MNVMDGSFEHSKTLAGVGAILLLLGLVPYAGWVLAIVGVVLLVIGIKDLAKYYQDENVYQNTLTGVKFYVVAVVAAAAAIVAIMIGIASATDFKFTNFTNFVPTVGFGIGVVALLAGLIVAFVFYVLAASHLKRALDTLAQKSGEASFTTAGTLLWLGAILTIVLVGLVLIFVAWIFATIGFFSMKSRQYQQFSSQQASYGYTPPSPSSPQPGIQQP
jgi:uncharacterized membrane protein